MGKRRRTLSSALALCAMAAVLILTLRHTLRRTVYLALPDTAGAAGIRGSAEEDAFLPLEVTPETVQAVTATLRRPARYGRNVTLTRYWSGGSGVSRAAVSVSRPWTRVDLEIAEGVVRHALTDGETTYLWYEGSEVRQVPAGSVTADNEQNIPTYEEVLALPRERIVLADYRAYAGRRCVYVETAEDGWTRRWWIGVDDGLLAAAERLVDGELVYRMEAEARDPAADAFMLPDGTDVREAGG